MNFNNLEKYMIIMMFCSLMVLVVSIHSCNKNLPKLITEINNLQLVNKK
jgi:hypothetical protein